MYYLLEVNRFHEPGPYRTRPIHPDAFDASRWIIGQRMDPIPNVPLHFELWEYKPGRNGAAEMLDDVIPLMHQDLIQALRGAGVDNMETFPANLVDPRRENFNLQHYEAVNIVGLRQCADLKKSEYDDIGGTGLIALGFRQLVIDEERAGGALLFRLAEAVRSVIVHESVKEALPEVRFPYLEFRKV
jgi:hypothetical protein